MRLPIAQQTEEAVLGACLLDSTVVYQAATDLKPDYFFSESNRIIFLAIVRLHSQQRAVELRTLIDALEESRELERVGGVGRLAQLCDGSIRVTNLDRYLKELRSAALKRRLLRLTAQIEALVQDGGDQPADELYRQAEALLYAVNESPNSGFKLLSDVIRERLVEIENEQGQVDTGSISSGFPELDAYIGGWRPGQMITVGARPGCGKTAFGLATGLNAAIRGYKVGKFSLEMSASEIAERSLSAVCRIDSRVLRGGFLTREHWELLGEAQQNLSTCPFWIDETPHMTITEMHTKARRLKAEHGLDLLLVDYLQLLEGDKENESRYQQISKISRQIKVMAKDLKVPVIALSQLNRDVEKRPDHRPQISDIRESGCVEQDSDVVLLLFRPEKYEDCPEEDRGITEVIIAKQRNGQEATVRLGFEARYTRFNSLRD